MSVVITPARTYGPFKSIVVATDRLHCDGLDLLFNVIGSYTVSADDSLAPRIIVPIVIPQVINMVDARTTLILDGTLSKVNEVIAAMQGTEGEIARNIWEFSHTLQRNHPLVIAIGPLIGRTPEQLDTLFIATYARQQEGL